VQRALNGAAHVHALDIDGRAVANTPASAFGNGVAQQVSAATVDLLPWVPDERSRRRRGDHRLARLSDLAVDRGPRGGEQPARAAAAGSEAELRDLLTRRELDVLRLLVQGETNGAIARALVVSEGTVKFHVKNILRKLRVANRAEATSRYLHLAYRRGGLPGD
jgi:DNA-binding CsgD family transcriptional regulator